jgi:hypothetical protein
MMVYHVGNESVRRPYKELFCLEGVKLGGEAQFRKQLP